MQEDAAADERVSGLAEVFLDDDELVSVAAQPDGSIAAWRIPAPRMFSLRSTFEF